MSPTRIAMWSGPRNISTAMMRAWENRSDTVVVDEPFYAYYLQASGLDHPVRDEVIASQSSDWREVSGECTGADLAGAAISYQKHMTHHLLPEVDRAGLDGLTHAFLVRDPAEVLVSYAKVRGEPTLEDLGLPQQVELYERFGGPVVDARDVLEAPEAVLRSLCGALDVPFDPAMLSWPAGPRPTDGVWAPHWYDAVRRSTGFARPGPTVHEVPARFAALLAECRPYYATMAAHRTTS